jgi:GTP1/Obg family GTP-binding protein
MDFAERNRVERQAVNPNTSLLGLANVILFPLK